jgi:glutamate-5-semialdehyde dehydrogenase
MATRTQSVREICERAKSAARRLATLDSAVKDAALEAIADAIMANADEILEANAADVDEAKAADLNAAFVDKLTLNRERVAQMADGVRDIIALPDPVGEELERKTLASGLDLRKVRVPLGVVAIIYEARPNVTVDAAALAVKSGNAVVLRGSSAAERSNAVLSEIVAGSGEDAGLPEGSVSLVGSADRNDLIELVQQEGLVDLVIPRGGEALKNVISQHASVPVIYAAAGNCHVYVDASADPQTGHRIAYNAKVQRPGVCNASETLLVHAEAAPALLPGLLRDLREAGVELRTDGRTKALAGPEADGLLDATEEDWATEYLSLKMAVKVVDSLEEAIEHVNRYGSGHSEAIVTQDEDAARAFTEGVDAACVYVNASTRFTDGAEFGMGAEMGNSTQKLHARGPIGLRELTTFKYVVRGSGQVRE